MMVAKRMRILLLGIYAIIKIRFRKIQMVRNAVCNI